MREIGICNSDWKWPRLIVPERCALCFYLRWGDKKRPRGVAKARGKQGERQTADAGRRMKPEQARRITHAHSMSPQSDRCEATENIDH